MVIDGPRSAPSSRAQWGQRIALGRDCAGQTVTVRVCDTTLTVELGDGEARVIRRMTTQPVRSIKGQRPRAATPHLLGQARS